MLAVLFFFIKDKILSTGYQKKNHVWGVRRHHRRGAHIRQCWEGCQR